MRKRFLRRHEVDGLPTAPLTWAIEDDRLWATCERGHLAMLDHEVADNGEVAPSVQCPECDWHVIAHLVPWPWRTGRDFRDL